MQYESDLRELRNRILFLIISFIAAFICFYYFSPKLMDLIVKKGTDAGWEFVYINPAEVLVQQLKIAAIASLIVLIPLIIIESALFIGPGIDAGIIGVVIPAIFACVMFLAGVAFSYFVLVPFVFNTLYDLGAASNIKAQVTIENYISLYLTLLISLGLVFELPLVSLGLTRLKLLNSKRMKKGRKIATIIALLLAALITPPDAFSQIVVAIPMMLLYEFSILLCKLVERKGDDAVCDLESQNLS